MHLIRAMPQKGVKWGVLMRSVHTHTQRQDNAGCDAIGNQFRTIMQCNARRTKDHQIIIEQVNQYAAKDSHCPEQDSRPITMDAIVNIVA